MIILAEKFDNFWEKFLQFLRENLILFARKCDDFCKNLTGFPGNSDDFCAKVWRSLLEHLTIFQENLMIFNFLVKLAKFSWRIWQIFCKHRQIFLLLPTVKFFCKNYQLSTQKLSKISCQNLQIFLQNLSDFCIKNIKFNFLGNIIKFLYKNCQIFLQRLSASPTKIVIFSRKKH